MDPNNYPKGSILNPFTESEYREMVRANTWYGGWIKDINDDIVYFTHGNDQHNYMGSKQHPYTNDIFTELRLNSMWIGGWVLHTDDSLRYYTASLMWYSPYHNDDLWGSEAYPVPSDIYVEMCRLSLWEGGWIESEEATYYVGYPTLDGGSGDGCGCGGGCGCSGEGSGCDEGSGCGEGGCDGGSGSDDQITPGSRVVGSNEDGTITISWDTNHRITITVQFIQSPFIFYEAHNNTFYAIWNGNHSISTAGEITYTKKYAVIDENGHYAGWIYPYTEGTLRITTLIVSINSLTD